MQLLWLEGKGWDEPLSPTLQQLWAKITTNVQSLSKIKIPRHIPVHEANEIAVVGFCDASERGYAAVLFLRCVHKESITIRLLAGKSKVAPIKPLSVPRLELNAALLLAKMFNAFKPHFENMILRYATLLFSDSQIVLGWLRTPPHKLRTHVCNRVVEILDKTPPQAWYHVRSEENPSDCGSRGLGPEDLLNCSLWWNGPPFLYEKHLSPSRGTKIDGELPELKGPPKMVLVSINDKGKVLGESILTALEKFSSLGKATRVLAYNLRFICRTRRTTSKFGPLKVSELRCALQRYILLSQSVYFQKEIQMLRAQALPECFKMLTPFFDEHGILRVGGRLKNAPLPFSAKHPVLLPSHSHLARLIVEQYHKTTLHGGPQTMRSTIQNNYWIPKIGYLIKSVIFGCNVCRRFKVKPFTPIMADLPPTRFDQVRPFIRSGVDFAGPFSVKETTRRKAFIFKAYVCIFVCFSTKATHLEVVTSLTTDAVLAAIDRLVARRGICSFLHSDNGTNFVGAARKLTEIQEFLSSNTDVIEEKLSMRQVQWMFNPPSAPHFGGLWEAAVKAFKAHFSKLTGYHVFTLEEFTTLTCRVEAILNSRPLCPLTNPSDDTLCLTPGHFLIGSALLAVPELPLKEISLNKLSRWQLIVSERAVFLEKME